MRLIVMGSLSKRQTISVCKCVLAKALKHYRKKMFAMQQFKLHSNYCPRTQKQLTLIFNMSINIYGT